MPSLPLYPLSKVASKSTTAAKSTYKLTSGVPVLFTDPTDGQLFKITETGLLIPVHAAPSGLSRSLIVGDDGAVSLFDHVSALAAKAPLASPALTGVPTAPTASQANNSTQIATTAYVDTGLAALIAASDAMVFKGVIDCSANPNYPAADRGHTYRVSVAGKIGGASGVNVEAGDLLLCLTDSTSSGDQATVGTSWSIAQTNLDGAVIGPASVTDSVLVRFDGTSGKLIKVNATNGVAYAELAQAGGHSILGRMENTTGDIAAIQAGFDHQVLRVSGVSLGFGAIALDQTNAVSGQLLISRGGTGASTAQAALDALLPSQSGNSGKFLSTDGTNGSWQAGGGGAFSDNGYTATGPSAEGLPYQSLTTDGAGATAYRTTLPPWYVEGMIFSNAADADHDLTNTTGWLVSNDTSFTNRVLFQVPAITKRFDATFAAGTGNGGMKNGTSLANNTWYRVWGVWGPGVTADLVADAGNTAPALSGDLAAYTKIAPAFDFFTDGSANIRAFTHIGNCVTWASVPTVLSTTTPSVGPTIGTVRAACPARNIIMDYLNFGQKSAAGASTFISSSPSMSTSLYKQRQFITQVSTVFFADCDQLETDSSGNFYYYVDAATWTAFGFNTSAFRYIQGRE